jgi:OmpA-OmpF porin, OOP family
MRYGICLGGLLLALAGTSSRAEESGFYLGAGVGEATQNNAYFHGRDQSIRGLAGYEFNRYFAAEAGYVDTGTQKDDVESFRVTRSGNGVFLTFLAKYPLGKHFAPYAKLGGMSYEIDTIMSSDVLTLQGSDKGEDFTYGGGLEFKVGDQLRLRADYEKIRVPDVAFDIYSLGIAWKF